MRTYKPDPNESIEETIRKMVALAEKSKITVRATSDGIKLTASPGDTAGAIMRHYHSARHRREKRAASQESMRAQVQIHGD